LSVFFFNSDNLYGPWLVFITECEFHNTDMKKSPSNKCGMRQAFVHIDQ